MGMARELEGYAHFLCDGQIMRAVSQQDAGMARSITVTACSVTAISQKRTEAFRGCQSVVGHADELQIVDHQLFVEQSADAATLKCISILAGMRKLFVITGYEEFPQRRREIHPRRGQVLRLDSGAIEQIAGDEQDVRAYLTKHRYDPRDKRIAADVAQMGV